MSSAKNFIVENNVLIGNTSFIGARGPNCTADDPTPPPSAFVIDLNTTTQSTTQLDFVSVSDGDSLTCVMPPTDGDYWPFGGKPTPPESSPSATATSAPSSHSNTGAIVGIILGAIAAVLIIAVIAWYIRKWAIKRAEARKIMNTTRQHSGNDRIKEQF